MDVRWTETARLQYDKITDYIRLQFGENAAHKFFNNVDERVSSLKHSPNIGSVKFSYGGCICRCLASKRNYIFYIDMSEMILVIGIFDTRQSPVRIKQALLDELLRLMTRTEQR